MIQDLLERRVPQVLGLYLGVSWVFVQCIQWLSDSYSLPADLDPIAVAPLLSPVPAVLILIC